MSCNRQHSIWRPLFLLAALTPAAACSSDTAAPAPAVLVTTTLAATTTTAAPTTTVPPVTTTTEDPEIAAVRAAHLAYLAMFELVGDPPNPDHPELALRATGDAYDRLRANLAQDRLAGKRLVGAWSSSIQSVRVDGDEAVVEDCLLDAFSVVDAEGIIVVPPDSERFLLTARLENGPEGWRVRGLEDPNPPITCDA